ncbi:hypothetical protein QBC44DRAFT_307310 [Cladorrhinum sp. PSN332]|nr:hypothetical protein QBC44DRAFT_307310 [Cladorrhinum sp. PSN332]
MATTTAATKTQTTVSHGANGVSDDQRRADLGSFLKAVKAVATSTVLDDLIAVSEDNKALKQDNAANIRQISRLQVTLDKVEKDAKEREAKLSLAQKEWKDLSAKLGEAGKKLSQTEKKIVQVESEAEKHLNSIRKDLAVEKAEVSRLTKFSVALTRLPENTKEITSKLNSVWTSALALAETYFGIDFPSSMLISGSEVSQWDPLKDHKAIMRSIPLPLSNSPTAKQMRVAAFLCILHYELRKHIFQPTYFLKNFSELNEVLNTLADKNPSEESHLRSILLKMSGSLPGRLTEVTQSCTAAVTQNTTKCVSHLIPEAKRPGFKIQLEKLCSQAFSQWACVQRLQGRVEFDYDAEEEEEGEGDDSDDDETWKPLILKSSPPAPSPAPPPTQTTTTSIPSPSKTRNNPTTAANGNNIKKSGASTTPLPAKPPSPSIDSSLTEAVVIWPSVYYYDLSESSSPSPVLAPGYILTATQIAAAWTEQKQLLASAPHRTAREKGRRSRALSFVGGGSGMNVDRDRDRDKDREEVRGSFLGSGV